MTNPFQIAELQKAVSVISSQGFNANGGHLYFFDGQQRLIEQLRILTGTGNSITAVNDPALSIQDIEKVQSYIRWMFETRSGWKAGLPDQIADSLALAKDLNRHIVLDLGNGYSCLAIFSDRQPKIINLKPNQEDSLLVLLKLGLNSYIQNLHIGHLENTIALYQAELSKYKLRLGDETASLADGIITEAPAESLMQFGNAMQQVAKLVTQVAFSNSTVLILGETGTGKELIAKAVHQGSPRKDQVMIRVNCAALPVNLFESELFGHERGSFTGAAARHIGKFELAENGTLFLDEIGEMPLEVQAKVLRAIQEREIERLGGKDTIKINVRIIAATNRNLNTEVIEGRFRSDLYYRLNVFPIHLPGLRERKEDIEKLASQFIKKFARATGKKVQALSASAIHQLMEYDWPGNVRELEHLMERSVLLATGRMIKKLDLNAADRKSQETGSFKTIEENERDHILLALNKTNGKIYGKGGAAELLGINFNTLNSRIKKLGIQKAVTASVTAT